MLLKELSNEKLFKVVSKNDTLRRSFDDYVWECELNYISDKLNIVNPALKTWEVGLCNHNYMSVRDYSSFVYYARECEKVYGLSDKCEKYLAQCEKLENTNLFEYHAKQFSEMWFNDEIQDIVKWVEDLSYKVYCGDFCVDVCDYLDSWAENVGFYFDEETQEVFEPARKVS